jgi:hypothetical protein
MSSPLPFLTAYDPSDLPGGSVDPLGFERGYLFLADKILPGLTNVVDRPRYFEILCAGASLVGDGSAATPRKLHAARLECVLRFERLWGLACVLASDAEGEDGLELGGLRGVTYVQAHADRIRREGRGHADARFTMLSRQIRYGAVGIYGAVAHELRFWDRRTLSPTADLGLRLGEAFLEETGAPDSLRRAARDDGDLAVEQFLEWGRRAHVAGRTSPSESRCLREALHRDPVRSRMADALTRHRAEDGEHELARLARAATTLKREPANMDLREAIGAILAYEAAYRLVLLGFERMLWLAKHLPAGAVADDDLAHDPVFERVREELPPALAALTRAIDANETPHLRDAREHLMDVCVFLASAATACRSAPALADAVLNRHTDVQRGKFDRGRSKMPWLERHLGRLALTATRVGGLDFEAKEAGDVAAHPYRLLAADRFVEAAG